VSTVLVFWEKCWWVREIETLTKIDVSRNSISYIPVQVQALLDLRKLLLQFNQYRSLSKSCFPGEIFVNPLRAFSREKVTFENFSEFLTS